MSAATGFNIDARILGMNTVDWRVSTAELTIHAICREPCAGEPATSGTAAYIHERYRKCLLLVLSYRRRDGMSRHRRCGTEPDHTLSALFGQRNRNGRHQLYAGRAGRRAAPPGGYGQIRIQHGARADSTSSKNPELTITYTRQEMNGRFMTGHISTIPCLSPVTPGTTP